MSGTEFAAIGPSINFIKQCADPRKYKTRPPPLAHPAALEQVVSLTQNWNIAPQLFAPNDFEKVLNSRGLILWFPKYGVGAIYHYGIVPQGAISDRSTYMTWNSLTNYLAVSGAYKTTGTLQFVYNFALGLPRLSNPIVLGTDLGLQFSKARGYGGAIHMKSASIATGATALTGLFAAANIQDTRDICQSANGADCFATSNLAENAKNPLDYVSGIEVRDGLVNIQGGDIPESYSVPDAINNVSGDDAWITAPFLNCPQTTVGYTVAGNQVAIFGGWYSPWNVSCIEGLNNGGVIVQDDPAYLYQQGIGALGPVPLPNIQEMGTFKVDFICHFNGTFPATGDTFVTVVIEHVFAGITDDTVGRIGYQSLRTQISRKVTGSYSTVVPNSAAFTPAGVGIDLSHVSDVRDQYISRGGLKTLGKCIGIKVAVFATSTFNAAGAFNVRLLSRAPTVSAYGTTLPQQFADNETRPGPTIAFQAQEINSPGQVGPCHVMRYDNIGAGQTMVLDGCLNVEAVATQAIAHLIQSQMMTTKMAMHSNVYPLVYALFNGDSPFKTCYSGPDYQHFLSTIVDNLTPELLMNLGRNDRNIDQSVAAGGFFSTLGDIGGGLASLVSPAAGKMIQDVGHIANRIVGAGQFGSSNQLMARGQFGVSSAGQWGAGEDAASNYVSSSGNYNRNRSRDWPI